MTWVSSSRSGVARNGRFSPPPPSRARRYSVPMLARRYLYFWAVLGAIYISGCGGGSGDGLLPGKKPMEVPPPPFGLYDGGGVDLGGGQLETAAPAADGPSSPPPADTGPPPPPPPPDTAPPPPPADAGPAVPLRSDGMPWPACPKFDPKATGWYACNDAGINAPGGRVIGRTADGFICMECPRTLTGPFPCWVPAPRQFDNQGNEVGDYIACRRPWLCVTSCNDRTICGMPRGPTCETQP